jgi:ADP-ribose pyrophosphatase YjhB (NUDIX family)
MQEKMQDLNKFTHFNFCPKCASPAIVRHSKNGMRCEACGFIYFHNTACGVAAIIEIDEKILLLRRAHDPKKGFFDLPGGFVDHGESSDDALHREIKEELNIEIGEVRYLGSQPNTYEFQGVTYYVADAYFICKPLDLSAMKLSEENSEFCLVDPFALDDDSFAFKSMTVMLERYRQQRMHVDICY